MSEARPASLVDQVEIHLREGHAAMREIVAGLTPAALDWRPGPDTNSIAAIFAHAVDAERHLTAAVAGLHLPRDREAAFRVTGLRAADLEAQVEAVERDIRDHLSRITDEHLAAAVTRGERTRSGAWWLLQAAGHSREHVGQAALTRQLYEQRAQTATR